MQRLSFFYILSMVSVSVYFMMGKTLIKLSLRDLTRVPVFVANQSCLSIMSWLWKNRTDSSALECVLANAG